MCYRQALQEGGLPTAQIDPPCCKRSLLLHDKIAFSLSSIRSKASLLALQYGQGTHVFVAQHGEVRAAPRVAHASSAHAVVHAKHLKETPCSKSSSHKGLSACRNRHAWYYGVSAVYSSSKHPSDDVGFSAGTCETFLLKQGSLKGFCHLAETGMPGATGSSQSMAVS